MIDDMVARKLVPGTQRGHVFACKMRRHDLVAEIYHLREPQAIAVVLAPEEVVQVLACAPSLKARVMLTIGYGCGLRGGEVTRLEVRDIDSVQGIIRVVQGKGQKDRNVMLPPEVLAQLRQWWCERPGRYDYGLEPGERWIFPAITGTSRSRHASSIACFSRRPRLPASGSR